MSKLTDIEIPKSVTNIGEGTFEYCWSLTKITCHATTPPTITSDTFQNYSADLYVPSGCKAAYEAADYWKYFNIIDASMDNPITLNDNDVIVTTIGDNIVVKNAPLGCNVNVYVLNGTLIASEADIEGDVVVESLAKGIYVVAVDDKVFKVMVK